MDMCGQIIYGAHGQILVRTKKGANIEIGTLLVAGENPKYILQVYDLEYGSQLERDHLELTSGLEIENKAELDFIEEDIQNYVIAKVKAVLQITKDGNEERVQVPKTLPPFFSKLKKVRAEDIQFLKKENENGIYLGNLRSGSETIEEIGIKIPVREALTHHILISATTGRGKSNILKVLLASILTDSSCGALVIDPHDEYYGRNSRGLKDVDGAEQYILYYTQSTKGLHAPNVRTLLVSLRDIKPWDFNGVVPLTDAQMQAMYVLYGDMGEDWLKNLFIERELQLLAEKYGNLVKSDTLAALKRKLSFATERFYGENSKTVFSLNSGTNTISDIVNALMNGKKVILDSSTLSSEAELLLASAIAREVFEKYRIRKKEGLLEESPVVSIVLEEAPRVLRNEESIFSSIAREGRKFKIGLIGVTQLVSLIPNEVLANINTKIILGTEMHLERKMLIESASQDISTEDKLIASLDKGEALVTSIFTKFAIPIYTPLFEHLYKPKHRDKSGQKLYINRLEDI